MLENGIAELPTDLIVAFTRFMDPVSVSQFSQTCTSFYELLRIERRNAAREHSSTPERNYIRRARKMDQSMLRLMAEYGREDIEYDGPDRAPLSQLVLAIHEGRAGALRGYLEAGIDPNGFWGKSRLLSEAACFDDLECVKVLLEYGADPALCDKRIRIDWPRTALIRASFRVFRKHLKTSPGGSMFRYPVWRPEYDKVTPLMKAGIRITNMSEILWIRWQLNFLDVLKLAVEQGTDLAKLSPQCRATVLHVAVAYAQDDHEFRFFSPGTRVRCHDDLEIVEWLIAKYPKLINRRDAKGETAFDWALGLKRFDITRLLFFRGIELGYAKKIGWYSKITNRETDIEKIELLLQMREELMNYDSLYRKDYLRRCRLALPQ